MPGKSPTVQAMEVVREGDLIPDNRLAADSPDLLEHDAIARGVAEIAWSADAPVNIALFGAWGSGKSSVYSMVEAHLQRIALKKVRVARYDAWKYGGRELKRNFISSLANELDLDDKPEFSQGLENEQVETKLNTLGWLKTNWGSLLVGVVLAVAIAALWVVLQALVAWAVNDNEFKATSVLLGPQAGAVFGLALVAALLGPKAFEGAVITNRIAAPEGSDQFAKRFNDLVDAALKSKSDRLVVFIDELDRCDPADVVATLIDLKTFLDQDRCAFIVAADREVIERALREVPQAKPVREEEPYYATPGAFLDKIFQHQLSLPPLRSRALTKFAHDLVDDQGGIWEEMRVLDAAEGGDLFDRTVFALIPVHVRSPRRVKVLLNNFATNARIAGSRGVDWLDRAHEIAVLTVLQTEFSAVADELRRVPRLLTYLRGEEEPTSDEVQNVVDEYRFDADRKPPAKKVVDSETVAGQLLSEDDTQPDVRQLAVANQTLRRHLASYLAKVAAAGIRDPRPDLLYLQVAGGRETLADPKLGDVIDLATDTAPDEVFEAFASQPSATLAAAVPLLVIEGDSDSGPGQEFAYEAACRLIERLDHEDHARVAQEVAPSLVAAATAGRLSEGSLPGALLVACWAQAYDVVGQVLKRVASMKPSEDLLDGLTVLLPYLGGDQRETLVVMLADRFSNYRRPLLTALRDLPIPEAVELWGSIGDRVLQVVNNIELPEPEPADPAATAATRAARAAATPEPTGAGIAVLTDIVDVVRERTDHEPLLSAVVATLQSSAAALPLREWVVENADQLVRTMSSPTRRAKHALVGMNRYRGPHRDAWAVCLPDSAAEELRAPGAVDTAGTATSRSLEVEVTALADQSLRDLLTAFATAEARLLRTLADLVDRVSGWASVSDDDLVETFESTLSAIGWSGGSTDDPAGQLVWDRKEHLLGAARTLATGDDSPVFDPFVADLRKMLEEFELTAFANSGWRNLAGQLPKGAARALSARVDEYEPSVAEASTVLAMRMAVRGVFGGEAPAASELSELDPAQLTTDLMEKWLALEPTAAGACAVLPSAPFTPAAARRYSETLSTDDRTALWLALRASGAPEGALRAVGFAGLGVAAVQDVRERVEGATRERDRTDAARQLIDNGKPAVDVENEVKKAASELAGALIAKSTAGDFRTAADVVVWVGGAGHGYTMSMRAQFNGAPETHRNALPQTVSQKLVALNLMTAPPKKKRRSLFGGA